MMIYHFHAKFENSYIHFPDSHLIFKQTQIEIWNSKNETSKFRPLFYVIIPVLKLLFQVCSFL